MTALLRRLWRLEGTVDRRTYAVGGLVAFAIKFALDWSIARLAFDRTWSVINYWRVIHPTNLSPDQQPWSMGLSAVLFAVAIPFIWFGVSMTLLRLRDAGMRPLWGLLFFLPVANLILFVTLMVRPGRSVAAVRAEVGESTLVAVSIGVTVGLVAVSSLVAFTEYGVAMFLGVPFVIGFVAAALPADVDRTRMKTVQVSVMTAVLLGSILIAIAVEGVICVLMAAPLAMICAALGAAMGCALRQGGERWIQLSCVPLIIPGLLIGEIALRSEPPSHAVSTSIEIAAPPEQVWQHVIAFPEITEKPEWYFRAGISYPLRARIEGTGVGATRYCEFTTGAFVEPIEVWDAPRRLQFAVSENPRPMRELSPWGEIDAPHLDGFMQSSRGEFRLEPLADGRTRLVGTTWYRHGLMPAWYWRLWSDAILHRIHLRVLRHIRDVSQSASPVRSRNS